MAAELSQPTLGLLRRILEEMPPADLADSEEGSRFWKDNLFDFGFAPAIIDIASSYDFQWGEILPDLFVGHFGRQNSHFSNALSPFFCEQTLKRLLAFGLYYSRDLRLGDELRASLAKDGFDLTGQGNKELGVPDEVKEKWEPALSPAELEIA